ncbi:MAG: transcription termination factor Rho [Actinomycetota bacterium]
MSDQLIVEREGLEKKDKGELQTIVSALGGTSNARMRKSDLIDKILELSGASSAASGGGSSADVTDDAGDGPADGGEESADAGAAAETDRESDVADGDSDVADSEADDTAEEAEADSEDAADGDADESVADDHPVGPDGEPLADWEIKVLEEGGQLPQPPQQRKGRNRQRGDKNKQNQDQGRSQDQGRNQDQGKGQDKNQDKNADGKSDRGGQDKNSDADEVDPNNRRSRRRGRGRGRDRDDAGNDPVSNEPIEVAGYLDLRDEGYAFLRVNGALPSRDDAYVSVKQVRQYSLRKGDHVTGLSRPANRNEKNPALQQLNTINGKAPEEAKGRPRFDKLTPLFPDERLVLECKDEPLNMTTRIIDLVAPIGKGQRGLIVSPPKAGKTSIMKNIARAIETNNPEVVLIVLLIDERPEEVTDMERHLTNGEVVSSTFDRPAEEHTAVAELTLERAKRLVEDGKDVCIILDGITRLARAYNMSAPQSGRVLSGGVDAAALYPPKRFLGAARNIEEGGSLTMLATALVEPGSRMDEVIFEEFKGTGNMELRLDRRLAEKRIFPAIDIDGSSTRNEELLRSRKDVEASWKLRKVVSGMNDDGGSGAAGIEMLVERLMSFKKNDDFLSEIAKARP